MERFWSKVDRSGECWLWTARLHRGGYGEFYYKGKVWKTHRVSWDIVNGPIPDGLWVLHRCDNPPCVNPAHLFLGTNAENVADCLSKGRATWLRESTWHARGARIANAKLQEADIPKIRMSLDAGVTLTELAKEHGVSWQAIYKVKYRKNWRHVP